ncbi:polysaccharide deacetylase family protein [bacterium]|nr:polysaccharide deacetylase family protein [bacterium]MBU1754073.1 polysaccharide deacetylase family protein [bacterium]
MKLIVKWIISIIIVYTGLLWLVGFLRRKMKKGKVTILCYHRVIEDKQIKDYYRPAVAVSVSAFERQMGVLQERYKIISLDDAVCLLQKRKSLENDYMVVTFDDGYADNYENAFLVLKKYNLPATIFLSTDYIDSNKMLWTDEVGMLLKEKWDVFLQTELLKTLKGAGVSGDKITVINKILSTLKEMDEDIRETIIARLKKDIGNLMVANNQMLTWEQIKEMNANKISFGAHTKSHRFLTTLMLSEKESEIKESRDIVEQNLNKQVLCFAYPDGRFDEECRNIVRESGLQGACSTITGDNISGCDLFALKRRDIGEDACIPPFGRFSKALFLTEISGIYDMFRRR